MDDWETPALSPAFQSAWEKANRIGDEKGSSVVSVGEIPA